MKIKNDFGNKLKGSIGEQVTASEWNGRNYLKAYARPSNPSTTQQEAKRTFLADGMTEWQGLQSRKKLAYYYHERFFKEQLSPLNSFLRSYLNIKNAGAAYTDPETGSIIIEDSGTHVKLNGALCKIYRVGGSVLYRQFYTVTNGRYYLAMCIEDQNYDLVTSYEGYVTKKTTNKTANMVIQLLIGLDPV